MFNWIFNANPGTGEKDDALPGPKPHLLNNTTTSTVPPFVGTCWVLYVLTRCRLTDNDPEEDYDVNEEANDVD
jgi:hypothetical protein